MKTEEIKSKTVTTIQLLRQIRDNISLKIANMSFEELKAYLRDRKKQFQTMPSR